MSREKQSKRGPGGAAEMATLPRSPAEWARLIDARRALSKDPVHAFFWNLDEGSHVAYFPYLPALQPALRARREEAWRFVITALGQRLEMRWRGGRPEEVACRGHLQEYSSFMIGAAGPLGAPKLTAPLGGALRLFAAGLTALSVEVGTKASPHACTVSEPDSYFVCFFLEFALAAVEQRVDASFWTPLLDDLAMMAPLFVARFDGEKRPVTRLLNPPRSLSTKEADAVERVARADLAAMKRDHGRYMGQVLRAASTSFWD